MGQEAPLEPETTDTNMTTHLTQPKTSSTCGQHCLAMLARVHLVVAIEAVGHRRGTSKKAILQAAAKLGLKQKSHLWTLPSEADTLPLNAIVSTRRKGRKRGHWCCFVGGVYHDPAEREPGKVGRNDIIVSWMEF